MERLCRYLSTFIVVIVSVMEIRPYVVIKTESYARFSSVEPPFFSDRQHLSYDVCLEVGGEIIRTVLCCIVY